MAKTPREMDPDQLRDEALQVLDVIAAEYQRRQRDPVLQ